MKALFSRESFSEYIGAGPENLNILHPFDRHASDLLLLGINGNESALQLTNAVSICKQLSDRFPGLKIIAHSVYSNTCHIMELIKAGAIGFVNKTLGYYELQLAIAEIGHGRRYISEQEASSFRNASAFMACRTNKLQPLVKSLSNREIEVLGFITKGYSTHQIAGRLFLSEKTIETHRKSLITKSGVKNTAELVAFSHSIGLV